MPSRVRTVANYNMKIIFGATGGIEPPWVRSATIHLLTNLHSAFAAAWEGDTNGIYFPSLVFQTKPYLFFNPSLLIEILSLFL